MQIFKKSFSYGAALLLVFFAVSVSAEEGDITQTLSQERNREQLNLQIPDSELGQSRHREENVVMNKNQHQYQYRYKKNFENKEVGRTEESSAKFQNTARNSWQGNDGTGDMNRHMQQSSNSGFMNRQNTANRSMRGGRR
jgi:hypothetical protein